MTNDVTLALTPEDQQALRKAFVALEHPSYAAKLGNMLGVPIEEAVKLLPDRWRRRLNSAAEAAIARATRMAVSSLSLGERAAAARPQTNAHRMMAIGSGAAGGYFGLPGLIVELPVTTLIFLRAIADIAASHGEDPRSLETRLACVGVFAFGSRSHEDDYAEIGYYEVRTALALQFTTIVDRLVGRTESLPATVEVIRLVASRFGLVVSDKAAAQLVPLVGAAAGAAVNALFMQHFQTVADGHFTVRRLERTYGEKTIQAAYLGMLNEEVTAPRYRMKPAAAGAK